MARKRAAKRSAQKSAGQAKPQAVVARRGARRDRPVRVAIAMPAPPVGTGPPAVATPPTELPPDAAPVETAEQPASRLVEDVFDYLAATGFTSDQARELEAIAAVDPGTAEETHNRWYRQRMKMAEAAGGTPPTYSIYHQMFHDLTPEQQALIAQCPGVIASAAE